MRMTFYASRNTDGTIHVTNTVAGRIGQHHVHDAASWYEWRAGNPAVGIGPVDDSDIVWMAGTTDCRCDNDIWRR